MKKYLIISIILLVMLTALLAEKSFQQKEESLNLLVKFTVKTESLSDFKQAVLHSLEESLKEEGNIEMKLFQAEDKQNVIFVYSRWKSEEAYNLHNEMPHTKSLREVVKASLETKPEIIVLNEIK